MSNNKKGLVIYYENQNIISEDLMYFADLDYMELKIYNDVERWREVINLIRNVENVGFISLVLCEKLVLLVQNDEYKYLFHELIDTIKQFPYAVFAYKDMMKNYMSGKAFVLYQNNAELLYKLIYPHVINGEIVGVPSAKSYDEEITRIRDDISNSYFLNVVFPAVFIADDTEWHDINKSYNGLKTAIDEYSQKIKISNNDIFRILSNNNSFNRTFDGIRSNFPNIEPSDLFKISEIPPFSLDRYRLNSVRKDLILSDVEYSSLIYKEKEERANYLINLIENKLRDSYYYYLICFLVLMLEDKEISEQALNESNWKKHRGISFLQYADDYFESSDSIIHSHVDEVRNYIDKLRNENLNIIEYNIFMDINEFFKENVISQQKDVVFKRYIFNGQDYVEEFDDLINAFQDYISKVCGIKISFEKSFMDDGVVYVISSNDNKLDKKNFAKYLDDFKAFMCFCDQKVDEARGILIKHGFADDKVELYISMFQKRMRRILLDLKHESQRKALSLFQELELAAEEGDSIDNVFCSDIPSGLSGECVVNYGAINLLLNSTATHIEGDYTYNASDKELISYIERLSNEKEKLLEDLHTLKNTKTNQQQKQSAWKRLGHFLKDHAEEIGDVAVKALKAYLTFLAQQN